MKTVLYLFAFAAMLGATSCSSKPDSPAATEGAPVIREDTAVDRTQVKSPAIPSDADVNPDSTMGP